MDRAASEEEKALLMNKFFDCAEAPIKEWIASFLGVPVTEVFDFEDINDVIGFEYQSKYYSAFVVTMGPDSPQLVDKKLLDESEKAQKACSMLFDAVRQVFMSVVATASEQYKEKVQCLVPRFDNSKLAFFLFRINYKAMQLKMANDQNGKIVKYLNELKEPLDEEKKEALTNTVKAINKILTTTTKESLDIEEEECNRVNAEIMKHDWLYLAIEQSVGNSDDRITDSLNRLPTFGVRNHNPEEETYIEKLKKENGLL